MGKKKPTLSKPPQRMTKRERSRWEKERRIQSTFILVLVGIGVVSVIVLVLGLLYDQVWYPSRVIAEVNGQQLERRDYWSARRKDLLSQWNQVYQNLQLYSNLGLTLTTDQETQIKANLRQILSDLGSVQKDPIDETTMQTLVEETVVLQGASDQGIEVSDDEADAFLLPGPQPVTTTSPFSGESLTATVSPTQTQPTPTPVNTLTPQERRDELRANLAAGYDLLRRDMRSSGAGSLGFSVDDYLTMMRRTARLGVVQTKMQERLAETLPKEEEQVWAYHILIQDRASRANQALQAAQQAVTKGEAIAQAVVQYSDDAASRDRAGEVVITRGSVSPELEAAAFALSAADPFSPVVEDSAGVHLLKFVRRDDVAGAVVAQHILIPVDRLSLAQQVWSAVTGQPTAFTQMAPYASEDEKTASNGGDLGWITKGDGQLSAVVEATAFAMTQTNQISAPVPDETGYHILQLVARDDPGNRVHVRQILILNGPKLAQQVLDDIRAGSKDFSTAVVSYSEDKASLDLAGDVGWVTQGDGKLPLNVEEAAFAITQTNGLSQVVEDDLGYYIVQLVERDDAANRVHLREVLVKRADKLIQEAYDYIVSGDSSTIVSRFMEMASKYSDDSESKSKQGDLGWFGRGKTANTTEIEERAFSMQVDEVSEPFEGKSGWHIVLVRGHEMNHPIDKATLDQQAQKAYEDWKAALLVKAVVVRYPPSTPTPTPTPPLIVPTAEPTAAPITETVPISATVTP